MLIKNLTRKIVRPRTDSCLYLRCPTCPDSSYKTTTERPALAIQSENVILSHQKDTNTLKSQNATSKGGKVKLPKAFTEKGLYMLATILKSKEATKATLQIIETFAKVREFSKVAKTLATEKQDRKKTAAR